MSSTERNYQDWLEIRTRVDSIATAVFLISGGALSLSITIILGNKGADFITEPVAVLAIRSWYFLFATITLFLLLKIHMVLQAVLLQFCPGYINKHLLLHNVISWLLGFANRKSTRLNSSHVS